MAVVGWTSKIIGLAVFIIVAATVLVPVIQDLQNSYTVEETNEAIPTAMMTDKKSFTLNVTVADGVYSYSIGGESIDVSSAKWIISDGVILRIANNQCSIRPYSGAGDAVTSTTSLVFDGTKLEYNSKTYNYTKIFSPSANGAYCCYFANGNNIYANKDAEICIADVFGYTYVSGDYAGIPMFMATGKLSDMDVLNAAYYYGSSYVEADNVSVSVSALPGQTDIDKIISSVSASWNPTPDGGSYSKDFAVTDYFLIVPLKYDVVDTDNSYFALIGVIPIIVFLSAIMIAVAMIRSKS